MAKASGAVLAYRPVIHAPKAMLHSAQCTAIHHVVVGRGVG